jgi:hypothetical protein
MSALPSAADNDQGDANVGFIPLTDKDGVTRGAPECSSGRIAGSASSPYLAEQFPDPANYFPVLLKVSPVNLLRELRKKSLQRSRF